MPLLVLLAFVPLAGIFRGFVNPWFAICRQQFKVRKDVSSK